ncbi:MAG: hypothetical protein AB7L28_07355, partial [Kofleriaceae bacterium]
HLEQRVDVFVRAGRAPAVAVRDAIAAMGPPDEIAASQRARLWRRFGRAAIVTLVIVVAIGLAADLPEGTTVMESLVWRWPGHVGSPVLLGWLVAFSYPFHARSTPIARGGEFTVAYPRGLLVATYAGIAFLLGILVVNVFHVEPLSTWWALPKIPTVICVVALLVAGFRLLFARLDVTDGGLRVTSLLGTTRSIAWTAVVGSWSVGERMRWLPLRWYWRRTCAIDLRDGGRVYVWPEMENADLLIERLRSRAT